MTSEFKTSSQMDGGLVDWPPVERDGYVFGRVGTVISALVSAAYKAMARLLWAFGRHSRSAHLAEASQKMQLALDERLCDPVVGAYRDSLQRLYGRRASGWALSIRPRD